LPGRSWRRSNPGWRRRAARLLGAAEVWRKRINQPIQRAEQGRYERTVAAVQARLDAASFARAFEAGQMLELEGAAALGLEPLPPAPTARARLPFGLTARELEVLHLIAQGLTDAEVADRLHLARRTVNTHLTSIYTKLNVSSRTAATRFAIEHDLA
jgi:DNA-binding NarL/FixJ family response regulator